MSEVAEEMSNNEPSTSSSLVCEDGHCERVVEILKAIAHPLRLRIVAHLCDEETNVTALARALEVNQAIVSQQLRILRMSGLVGASRQGGYAVYRLTEPHLQDLVACMEQCCIKE